MTNREDWWIAEQSQAGISSRVYQPGPYSDRESLLWSFDEVVKRAATIWIWDLGLREFDLRPHRARDACRAGTTVSRSIRCFA